MCSSDLKSLAFLYTNDEKSEREVKETLPFTLATKRIKYLGINLFIGNFKILPREIKEDLNRAISHVHGLEDSMFLRFYFLSHWSFQIPQAFFLKKLTSWFLNSYRNATVKYQTTLRKTNKLDLYNLTSWLIRKLQ